MLEHVTVIYAMHAGTDSFRLGHKNNILFYLGFISFLFGFQLILLCLLFNLKLDQ